MLRGLVQAAIILATCVGCAGKFTGDMDLEVPIRSILAEAPNFDGAVICTIGFARLGESVTLYSTRDEAINDAYDRTVILVFDDRNTVLPESIDHLDQVRSCGLVDLQIGCWLEVGQERDGLGCVPFRHPVHLYVSEINILENS